MLRLSDLERLSISMLLAEWPIHLARLAAAESSRKVKQFALRPTGYGRVDDVSSLRLDFARNGVWATQNESHIFDAILGKIPFSVLVGMRINPEFHLGHLTLMRELCWLVARGGRPIFVFSGIEADKYVTAVEAKQNLVRFGKVYHAFTESYLPASSIAFSDCDSLELQLLEERIARIIPLGKIQQLFGWGSDVPIGKLRVPTVMAAAFLLPSILRPDQAAIVLSDINQITHAEVAKLSANRLQLRLPSYSYRLLLPSLENSKYRMSVGRSRAAIFLSDTLRDVEVKLFCSYSGGRLTVNEHRLKGGRPEICSFFRVAAVLSDKPFVDSMYSECVNGTVLCKKCKSSRMPVLISHITKLREVSLL